MSSSRFLTNQDTLGSWKPKTGYKYRALSSVGHCFTMALKFDDQRECYYTDLSAEDTDTETAAVEYEPKIFEEEEKEAYQEYCQFHEDFQKQFGMVGSLRTIIERQMNKMVPPIPEPIIQEEMKTAEMCDEVEVLREVSPDGEETRRIKPIFIKKEPNRDDYATKVADEDSFPNFPDSERLPKLPPEEVVGYWEEELDAESDYWAEDESDSEEDIEIEQETPTVNAVEVERDLHKIATGLRDAATAYDHLADKVKVMLPYQAAEIIQQAPVPPANIPVPLSTALRDDGADAVINKLIFADHVLEGLSYNALQKKYQVSRHRVQQIVTGRKRKGGTQYDKERKRAKTEEEEGQEKPEEEDPEIKILKVEETPDAPGGSTN